MSIYTKLRATANKMLKGKGQTITLIKQSAGSYSVSTGAVTVTPSTYYAYGAIFDYGTKDIDGTLIKAGDKQLLLSAYSTTTGTLLTAPAVNDKVTVAGITYTITQIKTVAPGGTTVIYDCNIRV
jgi:hypothetical protein